MNKKQKSSIILASLASIACAGSLIAGSTYALFTSESKTNIAVTSGKVELISTIDELTAHSYENISSTTYEGTRVDRTDGTFLTGGTYGFADSTLTLDRVVPGDGVDFKIKTTNNSNIATKYRVVIKTESDDGLLEALSIKVNDEQYQDEAWGYTSLAPLQAIDDIAVSIELPTSANNNYQDKTLKFSITLEAIQGNASTTRSYALYSDDKEHVINLHGENSFKRAGYLAFTKDTKVTLNGNGKVVVSPEVGFCQAVWAYEGTVVINGGEYTQNIPSEDSEAYSLIYASKGGIVYINGGTFKAGNEATLPYLINCQDKSGDTVNGTIIISGGKFFNFDPSSTNSKDVASGELQIADGCSVISYEGDGGTWYEVVSSTSGN